MAAKPRLIVSLPMNSPNLSLAAEEAGADLLKLHLNVTHEITGVTFGSFTEEAQRILSILNKTRLKVGIVPGAEQMVTENEMEELVKMGIFFVDVYYRHFPLWLLDFTKPKKVIAIDSTWDQTNLPYLPPEKYDWIEAAVTPASEVGKELNLLDLAEYSRICELFAKPVIIPTQKRILPDDLFHLKETGFQYLMIGALVTGKESQSLATAVAEYRTALDQL